MLKKLMPLFILFAILMSSSLFFVFSEKIYLEGTLIWKFNKYFIDNETLYIELNTLAKLYEADLDYNKATNIYQLHYLDYEFTFDTAQMHITQNNQLISYPFIAKRDKLYVSQSFAEHFFNVRISAVGKREINIDSLHTIPILMYHTVNSRANDTINTQPERFEQHIKGLIDNGYNPISAEQLYRYYYFQELLPTNPIMITFDDGYKDNYINAYPILKKYNVKATIFTITSRIEHEGINVYLNEIPKLTWEEINAMRDLVMVQSHSWDSHRKVEYKKGKFRGQLATYVKNENGKLETDEQYITRITNDLSLAQNTIKEKTGYESYILSYPYGESNPVVHEVAKSLGIKLAVSVISDVNYSYSDLYNLKRLTVNGELTAEELLLQISEYIN